VQNASKISWIALLVGCSGAAEDQERDTAEPVGTARAAITVAEAVNGGCSTGSVKGLSLQIIAQSNCIEPGAFSAVPDLPNATFGDNVFAFLEEPARDAFVEAVESRPDLSITINSMLRTVAQQYLLYQWDQNGQCDIQIAAAPGNSNHETGLAFDTSQYSAWRTTLESHGFAWYGSGDVVHFDYAGPGAVSYKGMDVLAFQMLWNQNHPDDLIDEDGEWGPQTASRMASSPADGFPRPVMCDPIAGEGPDVYPAIDLVGGTDRFTDGLSAGVIDVFEGDRASIAVRFENRGAETAAGVVVAIDLDGDYLSAGDYVIERASGPEAPFELDPANESPENPPHEEALDGTLELALGDIAAGESKRITLDVDVVGYAADQALPPEVRGWVRSIDGHYAQETFGGTIDAPGAPQTFGGGRLEIVQRADIYSKTRWEWETDRREGATAKSGGSLSVADGAVSLAAEGEGAYVATPSTEVLADDGTRIVLRARRSGGDGAAALLIAHDDSGDLEDAERIDLDLPDDGAFHELRIEGGDEPALVGTITRVAIVPFEGAPGDSAIDFLRIEGGTVVGPPGEDDGGVDDGGPNDLGGSCACRAGNAAGSPWAGLLGLSLAALATSVRRRRRQ
jgi:MYXO-CTERM domain-containing protein